MTSPAITKSPENHKAEGKSPAHSASAAPAAPAAPAPGPGRLSWLRVFRLADLMIKQGC